MRHMKPITVAELIAQLAQLPQDAYCYTEGCDCEGPCAGAAVDPTYKQATVVVLKRDDSRELV